MSALALPRPVALIPLVTVAATPKIPNTRKHHGYPRPALSCKEFTHALQDTPSDLMLTQAQITNICNYIASEKIFAGCKFPSKRKAGNIQSLGDLTTHKLIFVLVEQTLRQRDFLLGK